MKPETLIIISAGAATTAATVTACLAWALSREIRKVTDQGARAASRLRCRLEPVMEDAARLAEAREKIRDSLRDIERARSFLSEAGRLNRNLRSVSALGSTLGVLRNAVAGPAGGKMLVFTLVKEFLKRRK